MCIKWASLWYVLFMQSAKQKDSSVYYEIIKASHLHIEAATQSRILTKVVLIIKVANVAFDSFSIVPFTMLCTLTSTVNDTEQALEFTQYFKTTKNGMTTRWIFTSTSGVWRLNWMERHKKQLPTSCSRLCNKTIRSVTRYTA